MSEEFNLSEKAFGKGGHIGISDGFYEDMIKWLRDKELA